MTIAGCSVRFERKLQSSLRNALIEKDLFTNIGTALSERFPDLKKKVSPILYPIAQSYVLNALPTVLNGR